jgi:prevent-host-death family protein
MIFQHEKISILEIITKLEGLEMETIRVTASEFQQAFGALSDKARHEPVVITKHGRDSLVVMSAEEWERLRRRDRQVGLTADLSQEWIEATAKTSPNEHPMINQEHSAKRPHGREQKP